MIASPHSRPPSQGFTLLEILLAVGVFAIVLLAIQGVFHGALRLHNLTSQAVEDSLPLQHSLAIIKRDLANIAPPGSGLIGHLQTTSVTTAIPTNASTAASADLLGQSSPGAGLVAQGQASPAFFTSVGIIDDSNPWGEIQKVFYYLADPTNQTAGRELFRSVTRNLLPTFQQETEDQWLLSGVENIFFSFYDGSQWISSWDSSTADPPLPLAIQVSILLTPAPDDPQPPDPIELVVPILVQSLTNQTAAPTGESG